MHLKFPITLTEPNVGHVSHVSGAGIVFCNDYHVSVSPLYMSQAFRLYKQGLSNKTVYSQTSLQSNPLYEINKFVLV